ncbi:ABC transporter permease [Stygiolobus caldivivus]|uniref:Sodium ABC transporter permease n=1 Tax=Stygiolobus caldivivus TaxID=2824673 RepID=A0A8D5U5Q1_9CREN|nr:ABC transporter permease [Stygiolobus caldivivus]BCU69545.1 sodium ABC transporter permease [Stygiolobus caldivivus]
MIRVFLAKEFTEIKRDKKLLLSTIILPFILLPVVGIVLYASVSAQPPVISVINQNPLNSPYVKIVTNYIQSRGGIVEENVTSTPYPDVIIEFPNDFYQNASNISRQAYVIYQVVISSNQQASDLAQGALYQLLLNISNTRIDYLEHQAKINVSISDIRDPIYLVLGYRTVTGHPTSSSAGQLAELTRIIALIIFPSATPIVFYLLEGITGERERRTLESLLATPLSVRSFIFSKLIIASVLGLFSSLGDIIGTLLFVLLSSVALNLTISLTLPFLAMIVVVYLLSVLLTGALSLVFLVILGGSVRNIQVINFIVLSFGMIASFTALFINPAQLSFPLSAIYVIPYVQISLGLLLYVFGSIQESIFSLLGTLAVSVFLIYLASRAFDSERLLLK